MVASLAPMSSLNCPPRYIGAIAGRGHACRGATRATRGRQTVESGKDRVGFGNANRVGSSSLAYCDVW